MINNGFNCKLPTQAIQHIKQWEERTMKNTALITGSYGGLGKCFVKIHGEKGRGGKARDVTPHSSAEAVSGGYDFSEAAEQHQGDTGHTLHP